MRDIAELHSRIIEAFAPSADYSEDTGRTDEVSVPPIGLTAAPAQAPAGGLGTLLSRLLEWRERRTSARLRRAVNDAEAESSGKSRQIATVVHEIRTPLNGILGMTHLLGQTKLTAEQQNYLSGIRQSGYALVQLVEDLLDYSTLEAGRFRLNNRATDLRQLIESVVEMLAPRAHGKRIEVAATISADVPDLLDFDPARLRQVLFNVIGNAVKFTEAGGVLVKAQMDREMVAIAVIDTGPGMTPEEQASIFGEYVQAGSAEARSGGTGLGLGIASRILTEFGGSLSMFSRKGTGSTFTIRFPRHLAEDAPAGIADRSQALAKSRVLLLAPEGPAAMATVASIETLGGRCRPVANPADVAALIDRAAAMDTPYTDLIVDHRLASDYACEPWHAPLHRILLVNPEERASQPQDFFDAWLIRPLREKSLIDVLNGRLRGFGKRDVLQERVEPPAATADSMASRQLDVVLGEDDPVNAMLVAAILRKAGHGVRVAGSYQALGEMLKASRPDLLLCDMHMPGGTMLEFLASRRQAGLLDLPVIVLTGESRAETRSRVLEAGAAQVLSKPVDPHQLLGLVRHFSISRSEVKEAR